MTLDRRGLLRLSGTVAAALGTRACGTHKNPEAAAPSPSPSPSASPSQSKPALPAEVSHGPRDRSKVALTFHGQGEPGQIEPLLRILERASVTVTVLAVGTWLDAYPDMAKRIAGGGHELGNHTQTHPALADLPAGEVFAEIAGCARRLHALTGSIGAWFRPSQTPNATALIRAQAQRAGYPTCLGYDVDSLDYTDPAPNAVAATVLGEVQNGSIVSLHFGHDATVAAMPAILAGLRERGLVAVTATDLLR